MRIFIIGLIVGLSSCGTPQDENNDDPIVINNVNNDGTDDPRCQDMARGINAVGGTPCPDGICEAIPCACEDGSVISASTCVDDTCAGLRACQSACGEVLRACGLPGGNNDGGNNTSNNDGANNTVNNDGSSDDNGEQGDPCTCSGSGTGTEDRYRTCYGTEDGCDGILGDPYECLLNTRNNMGVCAVPCTEDDYLQAGPCPPDTFCNRFPDLTHNDQNPSYFYHCQ